MVERPNSDKSFGKREHRNESEDSMRELEMAYKHLELKFSSK